MNWKIWAPIGIVIAIVVVIVTTNSQKTNTPQVPVVTETPTATTTQQETAGMATKPATGDVDVIVDGVLEGIADDTALFADVTGDASLVTVDSQEISNFSQTYNENEL